MMVDPLSIAPMRPPSPNITSLTCAGPGKEQMTTWECLPSSTILGARLAPKATRFFAL